MKKEHLQDLGTAINYLESYPNVKGSEAGNWAQLIGALKQMGKDLEDHLRNDEAATSEMIEALEE